MSFKFAKHALAVSVALAVAAPLGAHATNGYFAHGYGNKNKGMAGAGVVLPQDAMQAATNPAGMALVGNRMDIGLAFFSPQREYTVTGAPSGVPPSFGMSQGTVESENELFYIPHLAYNSMVTSNDSIGITIYGNGGMNTEYSAEAAQFFPTFPGPATLAGTFGGGRTGVNLSQLFIASTYAHKFNSDSAVGASLIFAHQRFKAQGLNGFGSFSSNPSAVSNRGHDSSNGWGLKLGGQVGLGSVVNLGASYQSKIYMSKFRKYSGLFADQGDFDIPATATVGVAVKITPNHIIALDGQRIWYSEVESIANPLNPSFQNCAGGVASSCLGGDNGPGFGWEDITVVKLGYQWTLNPSWTLRAGYSKGDQPIPSSEVTLNILAPGIQEEHYTLGFTWNVDQSTEVNVAGMYSPRNSVSGASALDPAQNIELSMKQYELEISFGKKF